jgi:hypothetical protein
MIYCIKGYTIYAYYLQTWKLLTKTDTVKVLGKITSSWESWDGGLFLS